METESLKILLALESKWTVSLNGREFLPLAAGDFSIDDTSIQFGGYSRKIVRMEWLRPNIVRILGRAKFRTQIDTITLYPGDRLPSGVRRRGDAEPVTPMSTAPTVLVVEDEMDLLATYRRLLSRGGLRVVTAGLVEEMTRSELLAWGLLPAALAVKRKGHPRGSRKVRDNIDRS